jgi:hypothetical protein
MVLGVMGESYGRGGPLYDHWFFRHSGKKSGEKITYNDKEMAFFSRML